MGLVHANNYGAFSLLAKHFGEGAVCASGDTPVDQADVVASLIGSEFFEVDARYIALSALRALAAEGKIESSVVQQAVVDFGIDPNKANPLKD